MNMSGALRTKMDHQLRKWNSTGGFLFRYRAVAAGTLRFADGSYEAGVKDSEEINCMSTMLAQSALVPARAPVGGPLQQ
eukprot:gene4172-4409_t